MNTESVTPPAVPPPPTLTIPATSPTFAEFTADVTTAFADQNTHFYLDTSFLVWMTTLGKQARGELIEWIEEMGRSRFHIPVWSGHEYLTHHVRGMIGASLTEVSGQLTKLADTTYHFLRPFLDEPLQATHKTPQQVQMATREMFVDLKRLASELSRWTSEHYQAHFAEVASLIGQLGLSGATVFESMQTIDTLERNRFSGRIPPGFQDRNKSEKQEKEVSSKAKPARSPGEITTGNNRFGDLVFWQEVLKDAQREEIKTIIILSNDRKNDWHMGGQDDASIEAGLKEMRRSWDPVPAVHPMLALEAACIADVEKVILIDSPYLAAYFHGVRPACENFISAALTVELPRPAKTLAKQHRAKIRASGTVDPARSSFHDGTDLDIGELALQRAMRSRTVLSRVDDFLASAVSGNQTGRPLTDFLGGIGGMSAQELVRVARRIHALALGEESVAKAFASDLLGLISELAPAVATCVYFGMLCSTYFDDDNKPRLPPAGLVLDELAALAPEPYAKPGLRALNATMARQEKKPLYCLSPEPAAIVTKFITREDLVEARNVLSGLLIDGQEILTQAQGEKDLTFASVFKGAPTVKGSEIITEICRMFGVPSALVVRTEDFERDFAYEASTGFETPLQFSNT